MSKFIPLSVPNFKGNELKYVTSAVDTEWVSTAGSFITEFEKNISNYVLSKGAIACQSGTAGIHISLLLCDVSRDDEVIVPALTFIAAVNPVKYIGADPIFMDCDDTLTIDPQKLRTFCQSKCVFEKGKLINTSTRKHIKAIVVVHVFGNAANMEDIIAIAREYNLKVIEDATEALGTYYNAGVLKGKYLGTIGDIGVYSFNGNKIITTGGGGMIVSNNYEMLAKAKHLTTQAKSDEIYYTHDDIGYNYRMTNLQAALGLAQLEQLENFIEIKKANYKTMLTNITKLKLLPFQNNIRPNYWFYALLCNSKKGSNKDEIINLLSINNVQSRPIWGLIHEQKPYLNCQSFKIEKAKYYAANVVNIPCSSNLSTEDIKYIVSILSNSSKF